MTMTIDRHIIICKSCGRSFGVSPSQGRREYCDACVLAARRAGGKLGGRGHKKAQPVPATKG